MVANTKYLRIVIFASVQNKVEPDDSHLHSQHSLFLLSPKQAVRRAKGSDKRSQALLAPTRQSLQRLLDLCCQCGKEFCISYNPVITNVMLFGKHTSYDPLLLNDSPILPVSECKYLGVHILAGKEFLCSARKPLAAYMCSANTILNVLNKPSKMVLMHLLYVNCISILTYACEIKRFSGREKTSMDVALNDCMRKIFSYNCWESTRELRRSFGYDSVGVVYMTRSKITRSQKFHAIFSLF